MSVRRSLSKREEKGYSLYGFRGVDMANPDGDVKGYRSTDSVNFINENGINRKRKGWKQLYSFESSVYKSSVDGIFRISGRLGSRVLAYVSFYYKFPKAPLSPAGEKGVFAYSTFMVEGALGRFYDGLKDKPEIKARLLPGAPQMHQYGNKAYFIGMGDFILFDNETGAFRRVEEDAESYVPTTTVSIDHDGVFDTVRKSLEGVNFISRRRKNTLVGVDTLDGVAVSEDNPLVFTLDGDISASEEVCVTVETKDSSGALKSISLSQSRSVDERNIMLKDDLSGKTLKCGSAFFDKLPDYLSRYIVSQPLLKCSNGYFMLEQNERGTNFFYVSDMYTEENAKGKVPDDYSGDDIFPLILHSKIVDNLDSVDLPADFGEVIWINPDAFEPLTVMQVLYSGLLGAFETFDNKLYGVDPESGEQTLWGSLVGAPPVYRALRIYKPCGGAVPDLSNITVEFSTPYRGGESAVRDMEFGVIYGEQGRRNRLFYKGKRGNFARYSAVDKFSYFPELNYVVCGGEQSDISGFMPLDDYSLAVFKGGCDSKVYICKEYTLDGEVIEDKAFYVKSGHVAEGCVSHRCVVNFGGDFVYLSENGVFGLNSSGDSAETRRFSGARSRLINPALKKEDHRTAQMFVVDNRLFLCYSNGNCYVADSGFKFSEKEDADSFNYEWWRLENIPINCFCFGDGQFLFGTEDGGVCTFYEGYTDQGWTLCGDNEIIIQGDGRVGYNAKVVSVNEGDKVIASGPFGQDDEGDDYFALLADGSLLSGDILKVEDGRIFIDERLWPRFYEGREIFIDNGTFDDWPYYVRNFDEDSSSFELYDKNGVRWSGRPEGFSVLTRLQKGESYTVCGLDEINRFFYLKDKRGEVLEIVHFASKAVTLYLKFVKEKTVCALWETPSLDMGSPGKIKSLSGLVFVLDKEQKGRLSFGCETLARKIVGEREIGGFDFGSFDFNKLSFSSNFTSTLAVPMKVRSFENIKVFFSSDTPTPCAVEKVILKYKIKGLSRGLN